MSESLHDEKRVPLLDTFKPWLVTMAVILVISYVPAFLDATKNPCPGAPRFAPENPVPETSSVPVKPVKDASKTVTIAQQ